jgi:hypothetical protein
MAGLVLEKNYKIVNYYSYYGLEAEYYFNNKIANPYANNLGGFFVFYNNTNFGICFYFTGFSQSFFMPFNHSTIYNHI